jgi:hypothetical protein
MSCYHGTPEWYDTSYALWSRPRLSMKYEVEIVYCKERVYLPYLPSCTVLYSVSYSTTAIRCKHVLRIYTVSNLVSIVTGTLYVPPLLSSLLFESTTLTSRSVRYRVWWRQDRSP